MKKLEFHRLQDKLTEGQFIWRRHYCITPKVYNYAKQKRLELEMQLGRGVCPTIADIYYQLIMQGFDHSDKVTFRNLQEDHTVRIKIGLPINTKLFNVQDKIKKSELKSEIGFYGNGVEKSVNIFSVAVCLMEAAIDFSDES